MRVEAGARSCWLQLPAIPVAGRTARAHLRHWLRRQGWPVEPSEEIEGAVNEAINNAVEHARRVDGTDTTVSVTAEVETARGGMRRVRVRVSDNGRWRPISADRKGHSLGLKLMNGLMDQVLITEGDGIGAGTEVVLLSRPVPTAP
jgi:anti-sigma regulatory factor (Ser/Thr protein kinase)